MKIELQLNPDECLCLIDILDEGRWNYSPREEEMADKVVAVLVAARRDWIASVRNIKAGGAGDE